MCFPAIARARPRDGSVRSCRPPCSSMLAREACAGNWLLCAPHPVIASLRRHGATASNERNSGGLWRRQVAATGMSARRAIIAAGIGNVLEYYDFGIYGFLATVIARKFFPGTDATAALLATFAAFGVGFLARPVGGIVLGRLGDIAGRKSALVLTIVLMAVGTAGIGLIPELRRHRRDRARAAGAVPHPARAVGGRRVGQRHRLHRGMVARRQGAAISAATARPPWWAAC